MRSSSSPPPVRQGFARSDDGVDLFWRTVGTGGPALVCCNGIGVSTFFWEYVVSRFSPDRTVLVWDYRGHGRSARTGPGQDLGITRLARDLGTVLDAADLSRAVLLGHSMGSQVILERYRQAPQGVLGLVPVLGTYGHPLDTFNDLAASRQVFDLVISASERAPRTLDRIAQWIVHQPAAWTLARRLRLVDPDRARREDIEQYMHGLCDIGFPFFFQMAKEMGEHSALDLLPEVEVPTLIVAGEFDGFTPRRLAERMHERIRGSRILHLEGASHAGLVEQPERINQAIADLLRDVEAA